MSNIVLLNIIFENLWLYNIKQGIHILAGNG